MERIHKVGMRGKLIKAPRYALVRSTKYAVNLR